ncbi:MAG: VOC family protein [Betaproteobacteria bacterium]|jgi:catechol 2,3-dioxygenase-like lactoylglutathione lyase family enzyme
MTQLMTMAQTRRADTLAVHSLDEYVISVPNLDEAYEFYDLFGLKPVRMGNELHLYAHNNPHRYARIKQGSKKRLLWLSFGVYAQDYDAMVTHIKASKVEIISAPEGEDEKGIWIKSSDGFPVQVKIAEKSSPSMSPPRKIEPESNGQGRSPNKSKVLKVHPLYMSHVLIFTKSVNGALEFYGKLLGLRLSDSAGDDLIGFVHSPHGSDHHLLAFLKADDYGFHHSSWTVQSIDEVGLGSMQMNAAGFKEGWGVGRHVLGSNYFRYIQDPWGSFIEYSYDIDFVPHDLDWPAANHPPDDSLYAWGPDVYEEFGVNFEVVGQQFKPKRIHPEQVT